MPDINSAPPPTSTVEHTPAAESGSVDGVEPESADFASSAATESAPITSAASSDAHDGAVSSASQTADSARQADPVQEHSTVRTQSNTKSTSESNFSSTTSVYESTYNASQKSAADIMDMTEVSLEVVAGGAVNTESAAHAGVDDKSTRETPVQSMEENEEGLKDLPDLAPIIVPDDEDQIDDNVFQDLGVQHAEIVRPDVDSLPTTHRGMIPIHAQLVSALVLLWLLNLLIWQLCRVRITRFVAHGHLRAKANPNSPTASRAHAWTGVPGAHCRPKPRPKN